MCDKYEENLQVFKSMSIEERAMFLSNKISSLYSKTIPYKNSKKNIDTKNKTTHNSFQDVITKTINKIIISGEF